MPRKSRRELTLERQAKRLEEDKLVKKKVIEHNKDIGDLALVPSYESMVILISLLEQSSDENPLHISPLEKSSRLLATDIKASITKLQTVISYLGFVDNTCKSGNLEEGAFHWNGFKETYYVVSSYENPKNELIATFKECAYEVGDAHMILIDIRDFLINECLQFLKCTREDYGLPHRVGDKSKLLFAELLWEWSPGQIFNFIWRATKEAIALMTRERFSREYASNIIIGAVERMVRKAKQEKWHVPPFNRHKNDKQSWMSYVYFNLIYELKGSGIEYTMQDLVSRARIDLQLEDDGPHNWLLDGAPQDVLKKYSMTTQPTALIEVSLQDNLE